MRLSPRSRILMRVAVAIVLAFIYIPLIVIAIYAFNSSNLLEWPPPSLTTHWFPEAFKDSGARDAFVTSLKVGAAATAIALLLGTLASLAVARHRFFGRETVSFLVVLPIALPGIVTGVALSDTFTQVLGISLSLFTVIAAHATFCIVVVYNNVVARLRRTSTSIDEASADLGADPWQTFRYAADDEHGPRRRCAAGVRPVVRRDHRHHVHDRRRRADPADLDLLEPLPPESDPDRERGRRDRRTALDNPG